MSLAVDNASTVRDEIRHTRRTPSDGEAQLVRSAQNGDMHSFSELVRAYQQRAFRLAYRVLGDPDAAADATQEAFISAHRHIGSFRGGSLNAWLMRIVTNACYDDLRKKWHRHSCSLEALMTDPDKPAAGLEWVAPESPQEMVERHELNDMILEGLARLPLEQRVTLVLADIEEYSYDQVAEIMGANIGTVKSRLARARGSLCAFLLAREGLLPAKYRRSRA